MAGADAEGVVDARRIVRGGNEAILKRVAGPLGEELVIEQFVLGQPGPSLRVRREGDSTVALDGHGAILFRAQTRADSALVITDADGRQVASYTPSETRRLLASASR